MIPAYMWRPIPRKLADVPPGWVELFQHRKRTVYSLVHGAKGDVPPFAIQALRERLEYTERVRETYKVQSFAARYGAGGEAANQAFQRLGELTDTARALRHLLKDCSHRVATRQAL